MGRESCSGPSARTNDEQVHLYILEGGDVARLGDVSFNAHLLYRKEQSARHTSAANCFWPAGTWHDYYYVLVAVRTLLPRARGMSTLFHASRETSYWFAL